MSEFVLLHARDLLSAEDAGKIHGLADAAHYAYAAVAVAELQHQNAAKVTAQFWIGVVFLILAGLLMTYNLQRFVRGRCRLNGSPGAQGRDSWQVPVGIGQASGPSARPSSPSVHFGWLSMLCRNNLPSCRKIDNISWQILSRPRAGSIGGCPGRQPARLDSGTGLSVESRK